MGISSLDSTLLKIETQFLMVAHGLWMMLHSAIDSHFHPLANHLPHTVLWMRLPGLPSVCWNVHVLQIIVVAAGQFIQMDGSMSLLAKGRFAHIAIEIDKANSLSHVRMFNLRTSICLHSGSDSNLSMSICLFCLWTSWSSAIGLQSFFPLCFNL